MKSTREQRDERRRRTRAATDARVTDPAQAARIAEWRELRDTKRAATLAAWPEKNAARLAERKRIADEARALALKGLTLERIAELTGAKLEDIARIARKSPALFSCLGGGND